jgi:hypothetical protein
MLRQYNILFLSLLLLTSCGAQQSELDSANKKIAELEAQIKLLKQESTKQPESVTPSELNPTPPQEPTQVTAPQEPTQVSKWVYQQSDDNMTGGKTYYANVTSTNSVEFSFPYSGAQNANLTIRNDPKYGKDIIFRIEKGQILCNSYDGCNVLVRFDDEKATKYSALAPADNSSDTIFISNYSRFFEKLRKAKLVRISPTIYQEGAPVFEFDISGFDQELFKPQK